MQGPKNEHKQRSAGPQKVDQGLVPKDAKECFVGEQVVLKAAKNCFCRRPPGVSKKTHGWQRTKLMNSRRCFRLATTSEYVQLFCTRCPAQRAHRNHCVVQVKQFAASDSANGKLQALATGSGDLGKTRFAASVGGAVINAVGRCMVCGAAERDTGRVKVSEISLEKTLAWMLHPMKSGFPFNVHCT